VSIFSDLFGEAPKSEPQKVVEMKPKVMMQKVGFNPDHGKEKLEEDVRIVEKKLLDRLLEEVGPDGNIKMLARAFYDSVLNWKTMSVPPDASGLSMKDFLARGILVESPSFTTESYNESPFTVPPFIWKDKGESEIYTIVCPASDFERRRFNIIFRLNGNVENAKKCLSEIEVSMVDKKVL